MVDRYFTIPMLVVFVLMVAVDCCRPAKAGDSRRGVTSSCGVELCRCSQMMDRVVGKDVPPVEIERCDPTLFVDGPECDVVLCRCRQFVEAWVGVQHMRYCPKDPIQ